MHLESEMVTKQKGEGRSFLSERTLWKPAQVVYVEYDNSELRVQLSVPAEALLSSPTKINLVVWKDL